MAQTIRKRSIKTYDETYSKTLEISVYYDKGGMNYFSGCNQARGYWLLVVPVEIEKRDGYQMVSFTAFTGTKKLVEETNRYSDKNLIAAHEKAQAMLPELILYVVRKNNLITKEQLATAIGVL